MVSVADDENKAVDYQYDGLGNQIGKTVTKEADGEVTTTTTTYVNDLSGDLSQVLVEETDGRDTNYLYGLQRISADTGKSGPGYYLHDGLGSVTGLADERGTMRANYSYDEFGIPEKANSPAGQTSNPFGFTGEAWDGDAELLYLRARYYSPDVGRFVSADPFGGFMDRPLSQNRYVYVENNPVNWVDPSGLAPTTNNFDVWADIYEREGRRLMTKGMEALKIELFVILFPSEFTTAEQYRLWLLATSGTAGIVVGGAIDTYIIAPAQRLIGRM